MRRMLMVVCLFLVLVLAMPIPAFAGGLQDGKVVFGGTFRLESGEVLDGDLAILGGFAYLEEDSRVNGSIIVLGGNIDADGLINGDLVVVGGNANLSPSTVVLGDAVTLGGNINRNDARIDGTFEEVTDFTATYDFDEFDFDFGRWFAVPFQTFRFGFEARVFVYLFTSFVLAALAVLVVLLWPEATAKVGTTVIDQPAAAGGFGLLTAIVAIPLLFGIAITICFLPVSMLGFLILGLAWLFGIVGLGYEVGTRMGRSLDQEFQPVMAAGLGTLVLSLVVGGIGFIPCVGWLASFLVGVFGLGAVLLTRFGSRPYPNMESMVSPQARIEATEVEAKTAVESEESKAEE
ncbi:MAG: hypothetical protein GTO14_05520 [Anaerolineales bacterium]|nr:hypothetical protein [Anaerolineales bacterium]